MQSINLSARQTLLRIIVLQSRQIQKKIKTHNRCYQQ